MGERKRIGLRDVRILRPGETIWDATVAGFGARRQQGDAVTYILRYRTASGRQRFQTLGRHGAPWTPDTARDEARKILGSVASGGDPAAAKYNGRHAITVAELCAQYLDDSEAGRILVRGGRPKKPLTRAFDRGTVGGHIVPLLGRLAVAAVNKQDIERFMHSVAAGETARVRKTGPRGLSRVRGGRTVATRAVGLLGSIFRYAVDRELRTDNPAWAVRKFADNTRERRLSDAEYRMLADGLRQVAATIWPPAGACLKFLALTGWRSGEALALRWSDVDLPRRTALLPDTKSGKSLRPLSFATCELLCAQPRLDEGTLVFPASRGPGLMTGFKKFARKIVAKAGLPQDITPHTLRHSYASLAADLGYGESTIAAMIGHKGRTMTSRYVHAADAVLLAAADAVARKTLELMSEAPTRG
jgi:integrase